ERGHVRCEERHAIAALQAGPPERGRELPDAVPELLVGEATLAVYDGGAPRVDARRALEEEQWRQLGPIHPHDRLPPVSKARLLPAFGARASHFVVSPCRPAPGHVRSAVPRLAKPARHAGYAPGADRSIGGCR